MTGLWPDLRRALREAMSDADDAIAGTTLEADLMDTGGAEGYELVAELSDLAGPDQAFAYSELCDLLATRKQTPHVQVFGCVIFTATPNAEAFARTLRAHALADTPVLALSVEQTTEVVESERDLDDFVEASLALIAAAADKPTPTVEHARTVLDEIDELVYRTP
ncbi:MAG: hypothetical protein OEV40_20125 [Acidimicrobiia bacterium]|nr:hypothetical protein [Acidimicrobiia bacterium]